MDPQKYRRKLQDRTLQYAGYALDPSIKIHVMVEPSFVETYEGQICSYVFLSLLARMDVTVTIDPVIALISSRGLFKGLSFSDVVLDHMIAANPFGQFSIEKQPERSIVVLIGYRASAKTTADLYVSGSGWNAYCGSSPPDSWQLGEERNIFGCALAAIIAASRVFYQQQQFSDSVNQNAWDWSLRYVNETWAKIKELRPAPEIWFIGSGSVGTTTAFFLTLQTQKFLARSVDGDNVTIENIARSPLFDSETLGENKALVLSKWLKEHGVHVTGTYQRFLHDVPEWLNREVGTPNIVVSAANEYNVRSCIESAMPPLQIYGTTGSNHQACLIRHIPGIDPCSLCLFPPESFTGIRCATGSNPDLEKKPDSALPFLSYLAGLMAAAEITKRPCELTTSNRRIVTLYPQIACTSIPFAKSESCNCKYRRVQAVQTLI